MKYVFDTGPFVSLFTNFYPSTFVTLWKNFDTLIAQGKIASTREAFREIEDQDDELRKWARSHKAVFTTPGAKEGKFVARIYSVAHFQANIEQRKLIQGGKNADPFVIARAAVTGASVVTMEKFKPHAAKIPNICDYFDVPCLALSKLSTPQLEKLPDKFKMPRSAFAAPVPTFAVLVRSSSREGSFLRRRPNYRLAPLLLFALLTAACGGGGGGGPSDTTRPGVQIQDVPNSHDGRTAFTLGIRFSESVSGFVRGDMTVTGAVVTAFSGSGASYAATLTPNTPPVNIAFQVPANVARDAAGNGNTAAAPQRVTYVPPIPSGQARISGRLSFDRPAFTRSGALDYGNIRQQPIRGVWVEAVNASGAVLERTRSDANGRYRLDVAANTEVRIRIRAHMQRSDADGPRWDVKVTDNTNGNALYVMQGDLASSGTGTSTRNLNASSGWVASASGGGYANARVAGPFAILSSTYEALQKFAGVDADINLPALEYRWSVRNRNASGNLADGAIGGAFYVRILGHIYLGGKENEDTDEYDHSVVLHEFAHHFMATLSRDDSMGGAWNDEARLDMRLAFSEGFAHALGAIITDDPLYRNTLGANQGLASVQNMETNPVNPATDANRIGWYHSRSVAAIVYDLYDAANAADNDSLSLGLAPIYNTLISNGFKNNRHYTSIYTFANQLPEHVPDRATTQSGLDALLRAHNIFGRGDNGAGETNAGETNAGGLPATARVLPVYKSITSGDAPITLCSVNDAGVFNRLGNRAFVQVNFTENGAHTLTLTLSDSTSALPTFAVLPYAGRATTAACTPSWDTSTAAGNTPKTCTFTGNFQASEAARVAAFDLQNVLFAHPGADSCFTFSVVKNP